MSSSPPCGICGGPTDLRFTGGQVADASRLAPTNHRVGEHGPLYACRECGTLQQPSALTSDALYREMTDDLYLSEEPGRRRTAARLLNAIGRYAPGGRLLDVGCGHGLLLDEARRRGYAAVGIEPAAASAMYARRELGLDVRAELEDLAPTEAFDVVVLADVLEHVADPRAMIESCRKLLADDGVLCLVTPDPGSAFARLAGRRWWGLLPAHTYLLPRSTLREIVAAAGLIVSDDTSYVRTFSLRYWLHGLGERGRALRAVAAFGRAVPRRLMITLSLGDERVVLAHNVATQRSPAAAVRREGRSTVQIVLPAYNAAATIPAVASELPPDCADRALLVDDASGDDTTAVALKHGFDVVRHPANRGYGANQKTCYVRALQEGADVVVMVHADNQYDPALVPELVAPIEAGTADVVMGSRLLRDKAIAGGMPRWKWLGNRFLTAIENWAFRRSFSEYHTGYRAFSADALRGVAFLRNSDGFIFDQEIIAQLVARGFRIAEVPIPTRYFMEASSVSFGTSVKYGLRTLVVLARYRLDERRRGWPLLRSPAAHPALSAVELA